MVNEERIIEALDRMHEHSTPGPDDVTNKLMIELKHEIAQPLAIRGECRDLLIEYRQCARQLSEDQYNLQTSIFKNVFRGP